MGVTSLKFLINLKPSSTYIKERKTVIYQMITSKIIFCKKIINELEESAKKYGNKAFISNNQKFYFMFLCNKIVDNKIILTLCDKIKLIGKLVCEFSFGYDKIIKQNLRKEILAEKYLYSCDCCWRHYTNKDCNDSKKIYYLYESSKEKCNYVGCYCPCRHIYRKLLWMKETKKLVVDCPDYKLYKLWKEYDSKRLYL